jgi:hypothetical protein
MFNLNMSEVSNPHDAESCKEHYEAKGLRLVGDYKPHRIDAKGPTIDRSESAKAMADRARGRGLKRTKELAEKMKNGKRLPDASDKRW